MNMKSKFTILTLFLILLFIISSQQSFIKNDYDIFENDPTSPEEINDGETDDVVTDHDISKSEYNGIYYFHADLPQHGQEKGNSHDVGDLLRAKPHGNEERYCAKWVQFDFDEHIHGEDSDHKSFPIDRIYYHIWWKSASQKAKIGIDFHSVYDSHTEKHFDATHNGAVTTNYENGYWLTTGYQQVDFIEKDLHDLTIKVVSYDALPSVFSTKDQYSFIMINPEDDEILKMSDKDQDGLNDFSELNEFYTNPEDPDTDNDGLTDREEVTVGSDNYLTDPNNKDTDLDLVNDNEDINPLVTDFEIINEQMLISDHKILQNKKIIFNNNVTILSGGKLTIENSKIKMNQDGMQHRIKVEKGGELIITESNLIMDEPHHWYSMTLESNHWHGESSFEILGKAVITNNIINYGSVIYIKSSNSTIIKGNSILHFYYGILCSYSTPVIEGNRISPFIGNGIFLWYSSPEIINNEILTYIGTGISCYYSSPIIKDSKIHAGSNDLYLTGDSHPVITDTEFNTSMVHIDDSTSSILVGSFKETDIKHGNKQKDDFIEQNSDSVLSISGAAIFIIVLVFILFFILKKVNYSPFSNKKINYSNENPDKNTNKSKSQQDKKMKKMIRRNLRRRR